MVTVTVTVTVMITVMITVTVTVTVTVTITITITVTVADNLLRYSSCRKASPFPLSTQAGWLVYCLRHDQEQKLFRHFAFCY
jgi:hypothetical protein